MSAAKTDQTLWRQPAPQDAELAQQVAHAKHEHLLLDPRYPQELNDIVLKPMDRTTRRFWFLLTVLFGTVIMWGVTWATQIYYGIGIVGINRPVMWAVYIVNFVYFIGIGHAGTFISAALRALKVEWRRPISRVAELVTVFGLLAAAQFPLVHLGRVWKAFWLFPYPNERQLWPSFHSPLVWDLVAITTYLTCSALFVFVNLIPDLAMARDHTQGWRNKLYTWLSLGWRGTEREWANHEMAANVFTYAIIPVMFSVHTIVSWDFAMALQPGWHSSIFGPYFVVGALFSGAGAVIIALVLIRKVMRFEYFLRLEHFDGMAKFLLVLSLAWDYFYFNDLIVSWYGQEPVEKAILATLTSGNSIASYLFYLMLFSNVLVPITLIFKRVRSSMLGLFIVSLFVQLGMYTERVLIIPVSLGQNWLPASWGYYVLRLPETLVTIGAFGLVFFLFLAASRVIPFIPVWEVHEGQVLHSLRRIGRALVSTRTEPH